MLTLAAKIGEPVFKEVILPDNIFCADKERLPNMQILINETYFIFDIIGKFNRHSAWSFLYKLIRVRTTSTVKIEVEILERL